MTEDQARAVLLLQAIEAQPPGALWTVEDRRWATRAAAQDLPAGASRAERVAERARLAMQRLAPRNGSVQRLLHTRSWRASWVAAAALIGALTGLVSDGLVAGAYFNLLSPLFWGLLGWNGLVYVVLAVNALRGAGGAVRTGLARRWLAHVRGRGLPADFGLRWVDASAPLAITRAGLLLHALAAGVALGLAAGLLLRGLVLDYRAGWASTLLAAETVQQALSWGLQPALALTGGALPAGPGFDTLRITPASPPQASAAPWMVWMVVQLLLIVVLPRALLLGLGWRRARRLARDFPIDPAAPAFDRWLDAAARPLWVLPHGAAPSPQAAAGLRAALAGAFGDAVAVHWADPVAWGDEAHPPAPPAGARAVLLVDLAATPEAEVQGRLLQALGAGDALVVADRSAFLRRFGSGERLAQREAAWRALLGDRPFASLALDDADATATSAALRAALER